MFVAVKEDLAKNDEKALAPRMNSNGEWIINGGCLHQNAMEV